MPATLRWERETELDYNPASAKRPPKAEKIRQPRKKKPRKSGNMQRLDRYANKQQGEKIKVLEAKIKAQETKIIELQKAYLQVAQENTRLKAGKEPIMRRSSGLLVPKATA